MDVCAVTRALIATGEKSAAIARAVRSEKELLSLLVEEKQGKQKNKRFVKDFKTLADVLVQETVRHDLSVQFPELGENFRGEESNKFTNTVGESITVEVKSTQEETCGLLETVLNGHRHAAELLAEVVHSSVCHCPELSIKPGDHTLPHNSVGVWMDPIDSTAQYINGETGVTNSEGVVEEGLQSVFVLIGLYDLHTGQPLIGVVNQPFSKYHADTDSWEGRCVWGMSIGDLRVNALNLQTPSQNVSDTSVVVLSSSEDTTIKDCLAQMSRVTYASGAGHKIMVTVLGLVDAYVVTKNSTFKWDLCGPHAIMMSRGGGIVSYSGSLKLYRENQGQISESDLMSLQIKYSAPDSESCEGADLWCNQGGIIVYSKSQFLIKLLKKLSTIVDA